MTTLRVGSLCTGYGGLELAVAQLGWDTRLAWVADNDPDASRVLAARFPDVPNLGDLTRADPEPVDVLTAGFPCQPFSHAGRRRGTADHRWIWDDIEALARRMDPPPRLLLLENVPGLLSNDGGEALGRVVYGLASSGRMGRYRTLRAADVGACHLRNRWFAAAWHPDRPPPRPDPGPATALAATPATLPTPGRHEAQATPDHGRADRRTRRGEISDGPGGDDLTTAVALLPTPVAQDTGRTPAEHLAMKAELPGGPRYTITSLGVLAQTLPTPTAADGIGSRRATARTDDWTSNPGTTLTDAAQAVDDVWRQYAAAVERHADALGRPPPPPTNSRTRGGTRRLNPAFVEWMMMLPPGWVTDPGLGLTRPAQLRILGNGVVPPQAAAAYRALLQPPPSTPED